MFSCFFRDCSSSAGYGQTMNNPYARDSPSRNPYDNRSASLEHRNDHRQHAPSHHYEDVVCTKHQFQNVSVSFNLLDLFIFGALRILQYSIQCSDKVHDLYVDDQRSLKVISANSIIHVL